MLGRKLLGFASALGGFALGALSEGKEEVILSQKVTEIELGEQLQVLVVLHAIESDIEVLGQERGSVEIRIDDIDEDAKQWELPRARFDKDAGMLWVSLGPHLDNDRVRLRIPAVASLRVDVKDGDIELKDISGEIEAKTVDGDIELDGVSGGVVASTIDGDISMRLMDTPIVNPISLATVDGDIDLEAGGTFSVKLSVSTVDGTFKTEFPVDREGRMNAEPWGGINLRGKIGKGGPNVALKTIDGDVSLKRRK